METSKTDRATQDATELYLPSPGSLKRPVVEMVAGSAAVGENELVPLLRKRLRFLLVMFIVYYAMVAFMQSVNYSGAVSYLAIASWSSVGTLVTCAVLVAILSTQPRMSLRQLRVVEFALFAVLVIRMIFRGYVLFWQADYIDRVHAWHAAGDTMNAGDMLNGLADRLILPSATFVVAYGVIIPNTWRRCAIVVAFFTLLPITFWVIVCIARNIPMNYCLSFGAMIASLSLSLIGVLSVYGAYRIESSRQEATEARRLGQYVLRQKIGGGGMGEVYLADHVLLRRPCALKTIRQEKACDPETLRRFEREVQITATLTHPNTVQIFDYGHAADGTFYYVMEYLPGLTLEELVRREGPLPPARTIHFLRQVCAALREAHGRGLIHRDIKPGNVMVCERGGIQDVAKLLDFGLVLPPVKEADGERLTQDGAVTGTPAYLSPEQAGGQEQVDARSDIYSLGALAYFLLTGQPPFAGRSGVKMLAAHLYEEPAPLSARRPDVPRDLEAVVLRCLAKKPEGRFPDVESLDRALAACQHD